MQNECENTEISHQIHSTNR